ncbi:hypothetical protein V8F20_001711 [Naviculisporaceae sp. PSN 640]
MSSIGQRYRAIGTCAGYLRGQTTSIGLGYQYRLASTGAKSSSATKKTRFATKKTPAQATKISQLEASQNLSRNIAAANTTTTSDDTVHAQTTPGVTVPLPKRTARTARVTEAEAEAPPETKRRLDPKSKEYQEAYRAKLRKYTALMVSIPLAIVTSFFLFKKLAPQIGSRPAPSKDGQTSNA